MLVYVLKRLFWMIPVFFLIALVSFAILCLFPGDYYSMTVLYASMRGMSRAEAFRYRQYARMEAGVDKPWYVQFWVWFKGGIQEGDWGVPWDFLIAPENGLMWTLIITGTSMFWAWILGIPLGLLSAARRGSLLDTGISIISYAGFAFPQYVWGWVFFWVVYKFINPLIISSGVWGLVHYDMVRDPLSWAKVGSYIVHLIPAWMIVGAPMFAAVVRHTRMGMLDAMNERYLLTARGKGLSEARVLIKHALRNALNPLASMFGLMMPTLLMGSILISKVLGMPTFGQVFLNACRDQTQYQLTAALLFYGCFLLAGNLISDLLLAVLDPRIRYD